MVGELGDLRPYLVQVLTSAGAVGGTGFVCHPEGYALTCWHVVEAWPRAGCKGEVSLHDGRTVQAELISEHSAASSDLALLKLTADTPAHANPSWEYLPLDVRWQPRPDRALRSFGYPVGQFADGIPIRAQLGGAEQVGVDGFDAYPISGLNLDNVDVGYSGAPLVDERTHRVIGLVHAKHHDTQAFIVPLAPLFAVWLELRALHDVFEHIRQHLGTQALKARDEKLHQTPFIALNLEAGRVEKRDKGLQADSLRHAPDRESREHAHGRTWERLDPGNLLPPHGKFILSADVGSGKTTFLQHLAAELVQHTDRLPLVITCEEFRRLDPRGASNLLDALAERLQHTYLGDVVREALAEAHQNRKIVYLLDGLDQVRDDYPSKLAERACALAGDCAVVIASRPSAVLGIEHDPKLTLVRLQPFSEEDQRAYFGSSYARTQACCALAPDLTQVPMLAYMVRELIASGDLTKAATRTELYSKFIHYVLCVHESNSPLKDKPGLMGKVESALGKFAFDALAQVQPLMQRVPIVDYKDEASVPLADLIAFGLVNRLLDRGEETLIFTHQSFQEYLAAKHASQKPEAVEKILAERWHPKWAEVLRFLVGLCGEALLERLRAPPDNVIHSDLFLAARCAPEVRSIKAPLIDGIRKQLLALAERDPFQVVAIRALGELGPLLDAPTQAALVARLSESNVRRAAAEALGSRSVRLDAATQRKLVTQLVANGHSAFMARLVLMLQGERLDAATQAALLARLGDDNWPVREAVVEVLRNFGARLDAAVQAALLARLDDENEYVRASVREVAVHALGSLGARLDAVTQHALLARLRGADALARVVAVRVLGRLGERLDAATQAVLVERLSDDDPRVRAAAVEPLCALGARLDTATQAALRARLDDDDWYVRGVAVKVLGRLGARLDAATQAALLARLDDDQGAVRKAAVYALNDLREWHDAATQAALLARLNERLNDESPGVRRVAVQVLGWLGKRGVVAATLAALRARLDDEDSDVRRVAVQALGGLGERLDAATQAALLARLKDDDWWVRRDAVCALREQGARLDAAVQDELLTWLTRLDDYHEDVRAAVVEVLGGLSERLDAATQAALAARLVDEASNVREAALRALHGLGARLDAATQAQVMARLGDDSSLVREAAVRVLGGLGARLDAATQAALVARLGDDRPYVRKAAVEVLSRPGARLDAATLAALVERLHRDYSSDVLDTLQALYRSGGLQLIGAVPRRRRRNCEPSARPQTSSSR